MGAVRETRKLVRERESSHDGLGAQSLALISDGIDRLASTAERDFTPEHSHGNALMTRPDQLGFALLPFRQTLKM